MSDAKETELRVSGGGTTRPNTVPKPPPPRTIAAQSRARNSFTGLLILGAVLALLVTGMFVALVYRPDHVKDMLILIGSISGYIAGSLAQQRRDEE